MAIFSNEHVVMGKCYCEFADRGCFNSLDKLRHNTFKLVNCGCDQMDQEGVSCGCAFLKQSREE